MSKLEKLGQSLKDGLKDAIFGRPYVRTSGFAIVSSQTGAEYTIARDKNGERQLVRKHG